MLVTLIASFGVSAILVGVMAALSMIERRLAPGARWAPSAGGRPLELATRPDGSPPRRYPFADRRRTGRMPQIIAGGGANPQLTNRSINGH